jgi:pyridoxamine 5'-phosphate oxidase
MKTIDDIIEFANQNPVTWLATSVNNQPHVRAMAMWFADKTGFYYHTGTMKQLAGQLQANPRVELGFYNPNDGMMHMEMVRITGGIEMVSDKELEKKLYEDRSWLLAIRDAYPNDKIFIFRIAHGEARYWTMGENCREKDIVPVVF